MKDWEHQRDMLFMHDNIRFINPTPRMTRQPVIERYDGDVKHPADFWLWVASACVLVYTLIKLSYGWM